MKCDSNGVVGILESTLSSWVVDQEKPIFNSCQILGVLTFNWFQPVQAVGTESKVLNRQADAAISD